MAEDINRKVGGDIFEIVTVNLYPKEFNACVEQAEREKEANYRPALANRINNMDTYDVIFLGYPSWFYTIPMAVATFLESYNLRGKTIVPFSTHGGGGLSGSIRDITRLCPGSTILEAIAIRDSRAKNSGADVDRWLRKLAFIR
jgi:flavodoxin